MYCGSCLRDNALAAELLSRGHDVTLLPVYTPTRTDETNVSQERVFFGGISVYLEQYVPLFRNSPQWLDRLWDSKPMLTFEKVPPNGSPTPIVSAISLIDSLLTTIPVFSYLKPAR